MPVLAVSVLGAVLAGTGAAAKDDTTLVSLAKVVPGGKVDANVLDMSVSADGRYVAFSTQADNLDANDTNGDEDIYVHDTLLGTTTLVTPGDGPDDASGTDPSISDDGQKVAFVVYAGPNGDIDPDDNNNENDVYVADLSTGPPTLELVSRPTGTGAAAPAAPEGILFSSTDISGDGSVVAFSSHDNTLDPANDSDTLLGFFYSGDIFVRDLDADTTELVSRNATEDGNRASYNPSIDTDGSHVSFDTQSSNLDPDDADEERDVYVRDRTGGTLTLASRADGAAGAKANDRAIGSSLSGDGQTVSFGSDASNLDPGDSDGTPDVYVRDIDSDDTELISRADGAAGAKANKIAQGASINADGDRVAFISSADNLDPAMSTPGSTNFAYIRDRNTDTTRLHSRADGGSGAIADDGVSSTEISSGGIALGFLSKSTNLDPGDTDTITDAYVRNTGSGDTVLASVAPPGDPLNANGESRDPSISADGRYVAFQSSATNIDPAATNNRSDIFVLDTQTGDIELASRETGAAGAEGDGNSFLPSISADGTFVAFESDAQNFAPDNDTGDQDIFVRDLKNDTTTLVSLDTTGQDVGGFPSEPSISGDGSRVAFQAEDPYHPDDGNVHSDIYVRDLNAGTTLLASRPDGNNNLTGSDESYLPAISDDGSSVAFESEADNLTGPTTFQQIVVRDIDANTTTLASRASGSAGATGNRDSREPTISDDGSRVAFYTDSSNLDPDDPTTQSHVYVRNLGDNETILASRASDGSPASTGAEFPAISGDGTWIAFRSEANNLDPASSDTRPDIYLRDLLAGETKLVSRANGAAGAEGDDTDDNPAISMYGHFVAFDSFSTNLDPADDDSQGDVYLREALDADTTAPSTTITSGPAAGSFNSQASFNFGFTVNEQFATTECRIDGGAYSSCAGSFPSGQLTDGAHAFQVRSTDRFDNLESPAKTRAFNVDTTIPDTLIDDGPSGPGSDANPSATFRSTEAEATLECSIDGAAFSACTSPLALGPLSDGDHGFRARSTDRAGNVDGSPAEIGFSVDTVISGRRIKAKSPQKGQKKKVKVKVTVKPGESATIKLTGKVTKGGGKLKKVKKQAAADKKVTLVAKLKKKSGKKKVARKLRKGKKVKAKLTVKVTDDVGNVKTTKKNVRLK